MPKRPNTLVLGAVAYAPKVVTIWEGFKHYFAQHGLAFDYILYSNYETQVEALMDGQCDIAWNSPLAWVPRRAWPEHVAFTCMHLPCAIRTAI